MNVELIRYLADSVAGLIGRAEKTGPEKARVFLDEAEELLVLGATLNERRKVEIDMVKEAA